jgi:hypothetical protein
MTDPTTDDPTPGPAPRLADAIPPPLPPPALLPDPEPTMLDVHPPHRSISTWRDFFIHIATIVIGLLIAVGLESGVERLHDRHELSQTRAALAQEQKANEVAWADDEYDWRRTFVELKNNLQVLEYLRAHPGTPEGALPGELRWIQSPFEWKHAVWDAAQQKGVVQRMSLEEANEYQEYYGTLKVMDDQSLTTWDAMNEASAFDLLDPDPTHLSPSQLEQVIQLTLTALQKHVLFGYSFGRVAHAYPTRPHTITWDLIDTLRPTAAMRDPKGMAVAQQITLDRLKAANAGRDGATITAQAFK